MSIPIIDLKETIFGLSGIKIVHIPSGIVVKNQITISRGRNRKIAMAQLKLLLKKKHELS